MKFRRGTCGSGFQIWLQTFALCALLSASLLPALAHASSKDPLRVTASTGFDYTQGKYGTDSTSKDWYFPLSVKVEYDAFAAKLTIPFLIANGVGVNRDLPSVSASGSGLGDISLRASYTWTPESLRLPVVELIGRIKFASADSKKGLGTGENEYTIQIDIDHYFGDISPFATVRYRFVEESPDFDLHNAWFASFGFGYQLRKTLGTGISYDWRQSASVGQRDSHELVPYIYIGLGHRVNLEPYFSIGLSKNSPDFGVGTVISVSF